MSIRMLTLHVVVVLLRSIVCANGDVAVPRQILPKLLPYIGFPNNELLFYVVSRQRHVPILNKIAHPRRICGYYRKGDYILGTFKHNDTAGGLWLGTSPDRWSAASQRWVQIESTTLVDDGGGVGRNETKRSLALHTTLPLPDAFERALRGQPSGLFDPNDLKYEMREKRIHMELMRIMRLARIVVDEEREGHGRLPKSALPFDRYLLPRPTTAPSAETRSNKPKERDIRVALCASEKSWSKCVGLWFCEWLASAKCALAARGGIGAEAEATLVEEAMRADAAWGSDDDGARFSFRLPQTMLRPARRYLIYQPSGGLNNQRIQLTNALVMASLLNRTCIVPPLAPHTNYYERYNELLPSEVSTAPRIIDFVALQRVVSAEAVPSGATFLSFVAWLRAAAPTLRWRDVEPNPTSKQWNEVSFVAEFSKETAEVMFFSKGSAWQGQPKCISWQGLAIGLEHRVRVLRSLQYSAELQHVARIAIDEAQWPTSPAEQTEEKPRLLLGGRYLALHVRRGDYTAAKHWSTALMRTPWELCAALEPLQNATKRLYVLTDERQRTYLNVFRTRRFELVTWEDLPRREVLGWLLRRFPRRMFSDVLGVIEQLIATWAHRFLGSSYSTFTSFVLRLRKYRVTMAQPRGELGGLSMLPLPAHEPDFEPSRCEPLATLNHADPC